MGELVGGTSFVWSGKVSGQVLNNLNGSTVIYSFIDSSCLTRYASRGSCRRHEYPHLTQVRWLCSYIFYLTGCGILFKYLLSHSEEHTRTPGSTVVRKIKSRHIFDA